MGWESRARGGTYYTRSRKVNGCVMREYIGKGAIAELLAETDASERMEARAAHVERCVQENTWRQHETHLAELSELTDVVVQGLLVLSGYHRHHRGAWRKRRGANTENT